MFCQQYGNGFVDDGNGDNDHPGTTIARSAFHKHGACTHTNAHTRESNTCDSNLRSSGHVCLRARQAHSHKRAYPASVMMPSSRASTASSIYVHAPENPTLCSVHSRSRVCFMDAYTIYMHTEYILLYSRNKIQARIRASVCMHIGTNACTCSVQRAAEGM